MDSLFIKNNVVIVASLLLIMGIVILIGKGDNLIAGYKDRSKAMLSETVSITMKKLIYLGTSAGGKRPKAVVAYNPKTGEFRSGQVDLPEDFKHYIIKFKEDPETPTSEIEMIWHEMAKESGISMMPCFLKEVDGINHFITERFDRNGSEKSLLRPWPP